MSNLEVNWNKYYTEENLKSIEEKIAGEGLCWIADNIKTTRQTFLDGKEFRLNNISVRQLNKKYTITYQALYKRIKNLEEDIKALMSHE